MTIRSFEPADASAVSALICTAMRVSNTRDYPDALMEEAVQHQQPQNVLDRAAWTHFYVAEETGRIIGCGAIGPYWGKTDESSLFSIFVLPECQGQGVGRRIIETLEQDEYFLRARRVEIPASITGLPFYLKMGYAHKRGMEALDDEGIYRLEKFRDNGCLVCQRINQIERGENPYFVRELETGYVVIGDQQRIPGYTVFLCKQHATELHHLEPAFRDRFLHEMALVAEAVYAAFGPDKLNYSLLGAGRGLHMHWHMHPRRAGDTPSPGPVWQLGSELSDPKYTPTPQELARLKARLAAALEAVLQKEKQEN